MRDDDNSSCNKSDSSCPDGYYIIEKILDKKVRSSVKYYLVKWQGFEDRHNTWEPLKNLRNVAGMVKEFDVIYEKQKDKPVMLKDNNKRTSSNAKLSASDDSHAKYSKIMKVEEESKPKLKKAKTNTNHPNMSTKVSSPLPSDTNKSKSDSHMLNGESSLKSQIERFNKRLIKPLIYFVDANTNINTTTAGKDMIDKILDVFLKEKQLSFYIQWKCNFANERPANSILSLKEMKEKYASQLLDYLLDKVQLASI